MTDFLPRIVNFASLHGGQGGAADRWYLTNRDLTARVIEESLDMFEDRDGGEGISHQAANAVVCAFWTMPDTIPGCRTAFRSNAKIVRHHHGILSVMPPEYCPPSVRNAVRHGPERAIGISATEDKVVQNALREVLEAVYEQTFKDCSYGFRPGRSAHDAVRALTRAVNGGEANWILEFDVVSFFDSVRRSQLMEMLQERVADGSLLRLIGKCLHVGVLDGAEFSEPSEGTVQGSTLSPMLGNVYLHTVLDRWFAEEVRPRLRGKATFIRYADDGVFGFERQDDAERVQAVLSKRMERFGLTLHPKKTRLLDFRRPSRSRGEGRSPTTFDFLGFCWYWRRTRSGSWAVTCKTRRARLARAIQRVYAWCRENRHLPVQQQHATLVRKVQGHINYFGVNGNTHSLKRFVKQATRSWFKWLNRRSQRARLNWERFQDLLGDLPLPKVRIVVNIWR